MSLDIDKLRQIILTLNLLNKDKEALPIDPENIQKYHQGLEFISVTLYKIILIYKNKKLSKREKISLIQKIPDPDNKPFINKRLAEWIYQKAPTLRSIYEQSTTDIKGCQLKGGGQKIDKIMEIVISPLKFAEDRYGLIVTVPLEITTLMVGTMGTNSQLISSTVEMLPFPPPLGWVPEIVGDLMLGIHVFSNTFNIFLNISRAHWDIVIQSAIGMFPQFLELSNGLTMQLISVNKVLVLINKASSAMVTEIDIILPILLPVINDPIPYLNPITLTKYVFQSLKTVKNKMLK